MVQKVNRRPHTVEAYSCTCACTCSCACDGGKNQYATQYKNYGATNDAKLGYVTSTNRYGK